MAFYGDNIPNYLDKRPNIRCPMQFHFGVEDNDIPASAIEQLREAFSDKDKT